jgi:hypothetical protein
MTLNRAEALNDASTGWTATSTSTCPDLLHAMGRWALKR